MLKQLFILAMVCLCGLCSDCKGELLRPGEHCSDCGDKRGMLRERERVTLAACNCPHMQGHVPITAPAEPEAAEAQA
jgi:hypothetical protein